ncbi:MAG: MFS transporter [Sphingomonadaceae bacterium]|nr:MFS transporter [Sphingomonadaceae bacterium]
MASAAAAVIDKRARRRRDQLTIAASALGTVFEWYDFFVYGTLAALIGRLFFPAGNETAQFLLALASFGVGFGVRPLGAVLFGYLGDRWGRKYTFLITITLMGIATAGVGLMPTYHQLGLAAPIGLIVLRVLQGLALGGEYGGAAIYVAEHAPLGRRGYWTSFIQASVIGGFLLSLIVVIASQVLISRTAWDDWGWRVPFLFSLVLLGVSIWMRMRLSESPVFRAMKERGAISGNPLRESFSSAKNVKLIVVAMLGVSAGLTVVWYTAQFSALYFLQNAERVDDMAARLIIGAGAVASLGWFVLFGWLSDRVGRKALMIIGYAATLVLIFPVFHLIASAANPGLAEAASRAPVFVSGPDCRYNPFAAGEQPTPCGRVLDHLSKKGVTYRKGRTPGLAVLVAGTPVADTSPAGLDAALAKHGWSTAKVVPSLDRAFVMWIGIVVLGCLSGLTYGPAAALLVELFPARIRYSSMSIPYHIGTGYFGGFLPFISQYIVARSGNPFAGFWYAFAVVAMALIVSVFWLPETIGRELD